VGSDAAGGDEAGFVGQHDGLYAVAQVEFGQDSGDVCLDGVLADDELSGDLVVRQAAARSRNTSASCL
jgi:hypothetical protein